jgi:hypothetical protein
MRKPRILWPRMLCDSEQIDDVGSTWDVSTFIGNALFARSVYIVTIMHDARGRAGGAGCTLIDIEGE